MLLFPLDLYANMSWIDSLDISIILFSRFQDSIDSSTLASLTQVNDIFQIESSKSHELPFNYFYYMKFPLITLQINWVHMVAVSFHFFHSIIWLNVFFAYRSLRQHTHTNDWHPINLCCAIYLI